MGTRRRPRSGPATLPRVPLQVRRTDGVPTFSAVLLERPNHLCIASGRRHPSDGSIAGGLTAAVVRRVSWPPAFSVTTSVVGSGGRSWTGRNAGRAARTTASSAFGRSIRKRVTKTAGGIATLCASVADAGERSSPLNPAPPTDQIARLAPDRSSSNGCDGEPQSRGHCSLSRSIPIRSHNQHHKKHRKESSSFCLDRLNDDQLASAVPCALCFRATHRRVKGEPSGEYTFNAARENLALEPIGRHIGMFQDDAKIGPEYHLRIPESMTIDRLRSMRDGIRDALPTTAS